MEIAIELLAEDKLLEDELLELLRLLDLLEGEQLEFDELELELELKLELDSENKLLLEFSELLELELELEKFVSGGMKGVVRSAPHACNKMAAKKNAKALPMFDRKKE